MAKTNAPRAIGSGVALNIGVISTSVKLYSAVDKREEKSNITICHTDHEPIRINQVTKCAKCGEIPLAQTSKAREVEGGVVILPKETLAENKEIVAPFKKRADIGAHPREQIETLTAVGDKAYFLTPEKGHEVTYATILALVESNPELAFVAQWAPASAISQFQLRVWDGVLMFQERTRAGSLREAPQVEGSASPEVLKLAGMMLEQVTSDFDPKNYTDPAREALDEFVAKATPVPLLGQDTGVVTPAITEEELLASLRKSAGKAAPTPRKRAPAKRAATTKAPAAKK